MGLLLKAVDSDGNRWPVETGHPFVAPQPMTIIMFETMDWRPFYSCAEPIVLQRDDTIHPDFYVSLV